MKNLFKLFAIALMLITVSCDKGDYQIVDVVHNQGDIIANVNGMILQPGTRMEFPHSTEYIILCIGECKVNINGFIYYGSGTFQNDSQRKSYR